LAAKTVFSEGAPSLHTVSTDVLRGWSKITGKDLFDFSPRDFAGGFLAEE
jgi:hypothetical protein